MTEYTHYDLTDDMELYKETIPYPDGSDDIEAWEKLHFENMYEYYCGHKPDQNNELDKQILNYLIDYEFFRDRYLYAETAYLSTMTERSECIHDDAMNDFHYIYTVLHKHNVKVPYA